MPSITSWVRLEPRCRDSRMREGIHARVWDPLWLLSRQWQVGEFEGEDAGTPVLARWRGDSAPLSRLLAGRAGAEGSGPAMPYDAAAMPLEAAVERRPVRPRPQAGGGSGSAGGSIRLAVEAGLHFLRLLAAQKTSRDYRAGFIQEYALLPPADAERAAADAETLDYWDLMAGRVPDARRLLAAWRAANGQRLPMPPKPAVQAADRAEVELAIDRWLAAHDALFSEPPAATEAWQRERMEYAFSAAARGADGELIVQAQEYHGGHLDWHSVDLATAATGHASLGAALDRAPQPLVRTTMPAPVSFRGAPAQRFWEFEDARIDYGLLPAGPGDLAHLLLSDFATSFGNDWYVIPIDLPVGTLTRTRSLVVADSFGVQTLIEPLNAAGPSPFSMYGLTTLGAAGAAGPPQANLLFLAPSLPRALQGAPQDELLLLRDEMSNLAWAVERWIRGPVEQRLEGALAGVDPTPASDATAASVVPAGSASQRLPRYRLASDVPANWVPLVPQRHADGSLRLVRGALLATDGTPQVRAARGEVLGGPALALFDEELPREGVRITRGWQVARWTGGQTLAWLAYRKSVGRGEDFSGLAFDTVLE